MYIYSRVNRLFLLTSISVLLFFNLNSKVSAQQTKPVQVALSDSLTQPIIISVKGGISKGSYQAGLNWGLLRFFRHVNSEFDNPDVTGLYKNEYGQKLKFDLSVYVGSSAGNINGLASALEWCRSDYLARDPENSLFWKIWTPVGLNQLFPHEKADTSPRAAFTRKFFNVVIFDTLKSFTRDQHFVDNCSVAVGITLTRQQPQQISIGDESDNLMIDSQRSVAIYESSVNQNSDSQKRLSFGHHPSTNTDNPFDANPSEYGQLVLPPFNSDDHKNERLVFRISEASSAVPLFFEPVELDYYSHRSNDGSQKLNTARFLDGGAFDNNPLSLGLKLYEYEKKRRGFTRPASLIYIDQNNRRDTAGSVKEDEAINFGIGALTNFFGGFISSAREYELEVFARDEQALQNLNLSITSNSFPMISHHLKSFGAFFGRPFREFDFYIGIYDAMYYLSKNYLCKGKSNTCISEKIVELTYVLRLNEQTKSMVSNLLEHEFGRVINGSLVSNDESLQTESQIFNSYLFQVNSSFLNQNGDINYSIDDFIKFLEMLESIDSGGFKDLAKLKAEECEDLRSGHTENSMYKIDCYIDPYFTELIKNPRSSLYEIAEQLAYKLWRVERQTGEKRFEKIPEFSQYFLIHNHVHRQPGFNWSNTIPRRNWKRNKTRQKTLTFLTEWFLPYEIQTSLANGILSFRYNTLQYRVNKIFSIQFPVTAFENFEVMILSMDWA